MSNESQMKKRNGKNNIVNQSKVSRKKILKKCRDMISIPNNIYKCISILVGQFAV